MPNAQAPSVIVRALAALALISAHACAHHVEQPAPIRPIAVADIVLADSMDIRRIVGGAPRYPEEMQAQSIEARVMAIAIVDTIGRIDLATVRFDRDAPFAFRVEVCRSLGEWRFTPLRRDGRLRPALMVRPFIFSMALRYEREPPPTTNARLVRETIARIGIPAALEQLASSPGCP